MLGSLLLVSALVGAVVPSSPSPLAAILQEEWENRLKENPLAAQTAGDHRYDDRLPSIAQVDLERRAAFTKAIVARLEAIDEKGLSVSDSISRRMLLRELRQRLSAYSFGAQRTPITADWGFHLDIAQLPRSTRFSNTQDYENYVVRLKAMPAYFDQHIAWMRDGLKAGFTIPKIVLEGYEQGIAAQVVDDVEKSSFFEPFVSFPGGVPEADRARLRAQGRAAVDQGATAAFRAFLKFFVEEYRPGARATLGASDLPRGREYYPSLVKWFTTLDVTPDQVHEIGLAEVARIRAEMETVKTKAGFGGSLAEFIEMLRTDPRFYAKTPGELLREASFIAKKMDGKLPGFFGKLPRLPYGVEAVPDAIAPKFTGGRYVDPPVGGQKAGFYWVNTYDLKSRPLYVLEALTLHEAVPGHHLQGALTQELTSVPPFRQVAYVDAFGEGWGLYSEHLGLEAGFYADPYSDFGRLTYEMWRACRLVVDTGIHWKGWTRDQALKFLGSNTALSRHEVKTETDRYISWPGQALAYKMGEIKIRELRARAEKALGPRFDLRRFHDAVLANGTLPLDVLEERIDAFIKESKTP